LNLGFLNKKDVGYGMVKAAVDPSDDLDIKDLSKAQRKALESVKRDKNALDKLGFTIKRGVIIVGAWGSGKSVLLQVMKKNGFVEVLEKSRDIYNKDIYNKIRTRRNVKEITKRLVDELKKYSFVALDNPDIPPDQSLDEKDTFEITWELLNEATYGNTPYLVIAINDFTFKKFEEKKLALAKISQHFDIVKLEWDSNDLETALKRTLGKRTNGYDANALSAIAQLTRTPRSAITLASTLIVQGNVTKVAVYNTIAAGAFNAFEKYVELLSQSGYKLSKSPKEPKWVETWRKILGAGDIESRNIVRKLIDRSGIPVKELYSFLGKRYKVKHWPVTAASKYHIIEKSRPGRYRFTDEFLAAAVGFAKSSSEQEALPILRSMAELYGKIGE